MNRNNIYEAIMTENLPEINVRHQTTSPGRSETTKHGKCPQNYTYVYCIIFKLKKIKDKEKIFERSHAEGRGV